MFDNVNNNNNIVFKVFLKIIVLFQNMKLSSLSLLSFISNFSFFFYLYFNFCDEGGYYWIVIFLLLV